MRNRILKCVLFATGLLVAFSIPSFAQTDAASVGLAFLSDDGGVGVNADYSRTIRTKANDKTLGWVGDISFNHKGFSELGATDLSVNTFIIDGGVRLAGRASDKVTWHAQGTVGIAHASASLDLDDSTCDLPGVDCSDSDTSFLIMPGGALTYWFNDKSGVKGQLNIPILVTGDTGSAVRFDINYVVKFGR